MNTNYKVHLYAFITAFIVKPGVSFSDSCAGSRLARTSFLPIQWRKRIQPIASISLKSASDNHVVIIGKILLFAQPGDLHVPSHFRFVHKLDITILIGCYFTHQFVRGIFPMEVRNFLVRSSLKINSEFSSSLGPWLQCCWISTSTLSINRPARAIFSI